MTVHIRGVFDISGPAPVERTKFYFKGFSDGRFDANFGECQRRSMISFLEGYDDGYLDGWHSVAPQPRKYQ